MYKNRALLQSSDALYDALTCVVAVSRDIDMAEFLSSDPEVQDAHPHTVYDLVANICHDGQPG